MIRRFSLPTRLTAGFTLLLILSLGIGAVAMFKLTSLTEITERFHNHPFTVRSALLDLRGDLQAMRTQNQAALFQSRPERLMAAAQSFAALDLEVREKIALVGQRYLGSPGDVQILEESYRRWYQEAARVITLVQNGQQDQARDLHQNQILPRSAEVMSAMDAMVVFATEKAGSLMSEADRQLDRALYQMAGLLLVAMLICVVVAALIIQSVSGPLQQLVEIAHDLARGRDLDEIRVRYRDEVGQLERSFNALIAANNQMVTQTREIADGHYEQELALRSPEDTLGKALRRMTAALRRREQQWQTESWLKDGQNELGEQLRSDQDLQTLAMVAINFLAKHLHSQVGCLYLWQEEPQRLIPYGAHACRVDELPAALARGEGLVGQAAAEGRLRRLEELPEGYLRITSAVGESAPRHLLIAPFHYEETLVGVVELGSLEPFSALEVSFVERACAILGAGFSMAVARQETRQLLQTTLKQADDLQQQQAELAAINEELEEQTQALRISERLQQQQQEELRATNEELEEKTQDLELQREKILQKNRELEATRHDLEQKATDLTLASQYKSDFLANMSHELRTPLNSLLILARDLEENRAGNLSPEQVEAAQVIHNSGIDLLELINDILDLAKIEAGAMELFAEPLPVEELLDDLEKRFSPLAQKKEIALRISGDDNLPEEICVDRQRLGQILNNLIGNAIKFTERGQVAVRFTRAGDQSDPRLRIAVEDTGIGIPSDQLQAIFEAFKQGESGTSRRYGGTGLGLAIASNLTGLLGGAIDVASEVGSGTTFTLQLPLGSAPPAATPALPPEAAPAEAAAPPRPLRPPAAQIADDREEITAQDRIILIIEDDPSFAATLREVCRARGFKTLCALTGEDGLDLARRQPPTAVILDLRLPGMSGWQVLDTFKADPALRRVPVHITSAENPSRDALAMGAVGFLHKPARREDLEESLRNLEAVIDRRIKELLLIEDDDQLRATMKELLSQDEIAVTALGSGREALAMLAKKDFDCMVLDLGLPDMSGFELLKALRAEPNCAALPVIVYTGRELSRAEERELLQVAESIIVKGAKSAERLIDETALFLHRVVDTLGKSSQQKIVNLYDRDIYLRDKQVLLVDDDMRNLFALSRVLEERGLQVTKAESGEKALELLAGGTQIDLILMDIMMPGMDGYETMQAIRARQIATPIIALTAKAMKDDRDRCLVAGADDYLAKPVEIERLMSMMRVWLYG